MSLVAQYRELSLDPAMALRTTTGQLITRVQQVEGSGLAT